MLRRICMPRQCRPFLVLIAALWPSAAAAQDSGTFAYAVTCPVVSALPLCAETAGDWSVCPDEPRVEGDVLWQELEARDPGYAYMASELTCRGKLGGRDMVATLFLRHNVCRVDAAGEGFRCRRPLRPFLAFAVIRSPTGSSVSRRKRPKPSSGGGGKNSVPCPGTPLWTCRHSRGTTPAPLRPAPVTGRSTGPLPASRRRRTRRASAGASGTGAWPDASSMPNS